jgi:hypothetical protein
MVNLPRTNENVGATGQPQHRNTAARPIRNQPRLGRRELLAASVAGLVCGFPRITTAAESQLTWAAHLSLAPTWFDPAETPGIIAPFMVLYALHDALVKPMPGQLLAPSLAESWSAAKDGLSYDFVLREGSHSTTASRLSPTTSNSPLNDTVEPRTAC